MKDVIISAHSIKEIKLLSGKDPVSHMTKIIVIDKDGNKSDICLFGADDTITVKADMFVDFTTFTNILGDEEE